ncbi:MAG: BatD family protein, partial [bacterium]
MKWKWKKIGSLSLLVCLLAVTEVWAAKVSISAQVSAKSIGLNNEVKYILTISSPDMGNLPNPHLPEFKNFDVTNSYRSSSFNMINGRFSLSKVYKYVLLPRAAGTFVIRPATITVNGKTFSSDSVAVTVTKRGPVRRSRPGYRGKPQNDSSQKKHDGDVHGNIYVKTTVDKKEAYPGEPILLTFSFFRRIRLFSSPEYSPPQTSGFWQEELNNNAADSLRYINNRQYRVQEFKYILYPLASGKYTIGSAVLAVPMGFFSRPKRFETDPLEIKVLPLPEKGRPPGFNGAVGDFRITGSIDKKEVALGDPLNLEIKIDGTGNIKNVQQLTFPEPDGWKKFDSKITENISKGRDRIFGEKHYEFVLVPEKEGTVKIPPLSFSFFDYKKKRYRTIKAGPFEAKVLKGKKKPVVMTGQGSGREKE